jgi:hypothetical protein
LGNGRSCLVGDYEKAVPLLYVNPAPGPCKQNSLTFGEGREQDPSYNLLASPELTLGLGRVPRYCPYRGARSLCYAKYKEYREAWQEGTSRGLPAALGESLKAPYAPGALGESPGALYGSESSCRRGRGRGTGSPEGFYRDGRIGPLELILRALQGPKRSLDQGLYTAVSGLLQGPGKRLDQGLYTAVSRNPGELLIYSAHGSI